jgi:hypothetical protein
MNEWMALFKALGLICFSVVGLMIIVFCSMVYDYLDAKYSKPDNTNWDLY